MLSSQQQNQKSEDGKKGGKKLDEDLGSPLPKNWPLKPSKVLSAAELRQSAARLSGRVSNKFLTQPTLAGKLAYSVRHPHIVSVLKGTNIKEMVSGLDHVMVMTDKGAVLSWGRNDSGQTGHGNFRHDSVPTPLQDLDTKKVREICCGAAHSVALTENGEVYSWGAGDCGQLGHGDARKQPSPMCVSALRRCHVLQVACGGTHTLALTSAREVYSWGHGRYGQLGHGELADCTTPQPLRVLHGIDIRQLLAGDCHSAALTNFGEVFTWGRGEYGQLGHGDESGRRTPFPIKDLQNAQHSVEYLSCGGDHMVAITYSKTVYSWGRNVFGQLGHGTFVDEFRPRRLAWEEFLDPTQPVVELSAVYCGFHHTIAVTASGGKVYTWGRGELGALGHTYNKTIARPQVVEALLKRPYRIIKATCGLSHTLVLADNGDVFSWGRGSYGQLGHGSGKPKPMSTAGIKLPTFLLPPEKRRALQLQRMNSRPASCPPGMMAGEGDQSANGGAGGASSVVPPGSSQKAPFLNPGKFNLGTMSAMEKSGFKPQPGKLRPGDKRGSRSLTSSPMFQRASDKDTFKEVMSRELSSGELSKELQVSRAKDRDRERRRAQNEVKEGD